MTAESNRQRTRVPATTTDLERARSSTPATAKIERHGRAARRFHAGVFVLTFLLLATGLWLLAGREGDPSPAARLLGVTDVGLHEWAGWALAGLAVVGATLGWRGARTLVRESLRYERADLEWFRAWPRAAWTGGFARHQGAFDPGQRIANLVLVVGLGALVVSGVGLVVATGGPLFVVLVRVHRIATYVVTPVIAGHVALALGLLPGYRGVWRSMHGGRVDATVARRLWPAWLERREQRRPERRA